MTKKTTKTPAKKSTVAKLRWSIGIFTSAKSGEPVVAYCDKSGRIAPYLEKTVTGKMARVHMVFFGMKFSEARAKLLKVAGSKAMKKTSKKEAVSRAA